MARPKSADKRIAILEAATAVFAKRGVWSTPTSAVSKTAGVAEGTLFTYFKTKEVLMNELYRALKVEIAGALLPGFPEKGTPKAKFQHIWDRYTHWGTANPDKFKVLAQLRTSDQVTEESRRVGSEPFVGIERLAKECVRQGIIRNHPLPFLAELMSGMAETTMLFMAQSRAKKQREEYCEQGFKVFWKGISD